MKYKKSKENVYIAKENFVGAMKEFFVAIVIDENGREGVVAQIDLNRYPLIEKALMGASQSDKEAILKAAPDCAKKSGMKVKVLRFTQPEIIAEF